MGNDPSSMWGRFDVRLWNLFLPVAMAACGPGDINGAASGDGSSSTGDESGDGDTTGDGPCVDQDDCPSSQICVDGECIDYYSTDGNYYDGNWYFTCYDVTDCGGGEVCEGYECIPTDDPPPCEGVDGVEVLPIPEPGEPGEPVLAIAFTDHDGDGAQELAVLEAGSVTLWWEDGAQSTQPLLEPVEGPGQLIAGQLDGIDGPDLVVVGDSAGSIETYLAVPGGGLTAGLTGFETFAPVAQAQLGDLDGDGRLDLAALLSQGSVERTLRVFSGDGSGGLEEGGGLPVEGDLYRRIAVGRLSGLPVDELVTQEGNSVFVWNVDSGFGPDLATSYMTAEAADLLAADVDASGSADVVRVSPSGFSVITEWYDEGGAVPPGETYWTVQGYYTRLGAGDIDGDGWTDLVLGGGDQLRVRLGAQNCVLDLGDHASHELAVGDWDGDGHDEMALLADGIVTVLRLQ